MIHTHDKNKIVPTCTACIISIHMSNLGKKGGAVNKKKGSDYFKMVRAAGIAKQKANKLPLDKSTSGVLE